MRVGKRTPFTCFREEFCRALERTNSATARGIHGRFHEQLGLLGEKALVFLRVFHVPDGPHATAFPNSNAMFSRVGPNAMLCGVNHVVRDPRTGRCPVHKKCSAIDLFRW